MRYLFLLTLFLAGCAMSPLLRDGSRAMLPAMPAPTADAGTNVAESTTLISGTLQWDKSTNATYSYNWTNWNFAASQGGTTNGTNASIVLSDIGTNYAGVRAVNSLGVFGPWAYITGQIYRSNWVFIKGLETRSQWKTNTPMTAWTPCPPTNAMQATNFQQYFRPVIVQSNWLKLDMK